MAQHGFLPNESTALYRLDNETHFWEWWQIGHWIDVVRLDRGLNWKPGLTSNPHKYSIFTSEKSNMSICHLSGQFCPRHETALIPGVFINEAYTRESNLHHTYNSVVYTEHSTNFQIVSILGHWCECVSNTHTQTDRQTDTRAKEAQDGLFSYQEEPLTSSRLAQKNQQGNFA